MSSELDPGKMSGRRIVIGGPRRRLLEGLKEIASRTCQIVAVSSNFTVVHQSIRLLTPDLVVVDAASPCWEPGFIVDRLGGLSRDLRILAFVPDERMGDAALGELLTTGHVTLLPASASEELFHETLLRMTGGKPDASPVIAASSAELPSGESQDMLTPRQRDILRLICSAESTKDIARILHISTRTVEFHKYRMMKTLDVNTMAELILFGIDSGLGAASRQALSAAAGAFAHSVKSRIKPPARAPGLFWRQPRSSDVNARGKYFTRG